MSFHDAQTPEDLPPEHLSVDDPQEDPEDKESEPEEEDDDDNPKNHPRGCSCWDCQYERAAHRSRMNDFEDTDGKDWT